MSCVSTEDTEFRRYLETRSPQGERIVDHMVKTGISLEHERHAYETVKELQARHAGTNPSPEKLKIEQERAEREERDIVQREVEKKMAEKHELHLTMKGAEGLSPEKKRDMSEALKLEDWIDRSTAIAEALGVEATPE